MSIEKMIAIVQVYINIRKNKEINIILRNENDIAKLFKAYSIASNWLEQNNVIFIN